MRRGTSPLDIIVNFWEMGICERVGCLEQGSCPTCSVSFSGAVPGGRGFTLCVTVGTLSPATAPQLCSFSIRPTFPVFLFFIDSCCTSGHCRSLFPLSPFLPSFHCYSCCSCLSLLLRSSYAILNSRPFCVPILLDVGLPF